MPDPTPTASQAADVVALYRARVPLIAVESPEEDRVLRALIEAATAAGARVYTWDCVEGCLDETGRPLGVPSQQSANGADLDEALQYVAASTTRALWVLRDPQRWYGSPFTLRRLRSLASKLPASPVPRSLVLLGPGGELPPELAGAVVAVRWEPPTRDEVAAIYDATRRNVRSRDCAVGAPVGCECVACAAFREAACPAGERDAAIDAAVGLGGEAVSTVYAKSLVAKRRIVPALVAAEKRRVVAKAQGIEWLDPDPRGLAAIGGNEEALAWLGRRARAFTPEARAFGLKAPKGLLLTGVPGTGKSLLPKACAAAWGVPLLRLDLGGVKSKFVGESEARIRAALALADSVGRCVLLIDEIEKALGGGASGAQDGNVSGDQLGALLTWLNDKTSEVFVVATANDVTKLPPELCRKGRLDEVFFFDLPTATERAAIAAVGARAVGRDPGRFDLAALAAASEGFVGAEIVAAFDEALVCAFDEGAADLTTAHVVAALRATTPLSRGQRDKVEALRRWATETQARRASRPEAAPLAAVGGGRALDF